MWAESRLGTHRPVNTCDRSLVMLRWTQFPTFRWKSARWLLLRHLSSKSVWMRRLEALGCILRLIFWYKEQASSTWLKSLQMLRRIRPQWPSWTVCSYHGQGSLSWVPVYIPATGYLEFPGMGLLHVASWIFNLFRKADLSLEATQILATGSPLCAVDQDNWRDVAYLSDILLRRGSRAKVSKMAAAIKNRIRLDASPAVNEWVKPVERVRADATESWLWSRENSIAVALAVGRQQVSLSIKAVYCEQLLIPFFSDFLEVLCWSEAIVQAGRFLRQDQATTAADLVKMLKHTHTLRFMNSCKGDKMLNKCAWRLLHRVQLEKLQRQDGEPGASLDLETSCSSKVPGRHEEMLSWSKTLWSRHAQFYCKWAKSNKLVLLNPVPKRSEFELQLGQVCTVCFFCQTI